MQTLRGFHATWAYVAIVVNGLVGVGALAAWRIPRLRGRWLWIVTGIAEVAFLVQVVVGVVLVSGKDYTVPKFHIFYGILVFVTIGFAYSYRRQLRGPRGRRELIYGCVGLFLMGLGIRAILQVS